MESAMEFSEEYKPPMSANSVPVSPIDQEQQHAPNAPNLNLEAGGNSSDDRNEEERKNHAAALTVLKDRIQKKLLYMENRIGTADRTIASDLPSPSCTCGSRERHEMMLSKMRRLLKLFEVQKDLHKTLKKHRLGPEVIAIGDEETKKLLKVLLKRAISKFKSLDQSNLRSVVGNQQAINKLRENGFKAEYNAFQSLHNARILNESDGCTNEIAKLFEKCHL